MLFCPMVYRLAQRELLDVGASPGFSAAHLARGGGVAASRAHRLRRGTGDTQDIETGQPGVRIFSSNDTAAALSAATAAGRPA